VFTAPVFQVLVHPDKAHYGDNPSFIPTSWELTKKNNSGAQVLGSVGFVAGATF
jgi:hypothetical protein